MNGRTNVGYRASALRGLIAVLILPAGCATWIEPSETGDASLRLRETTATARDVRLSATVLGSEDSVRLLGVDVNATGVQPVWLDDEASLRRSIEALPCCATSSSAAAGEPINVVLVGRLDDIGAALVRRGYRRELSPPEIEQRMFGRAPGLVLRKRAQAGASANWLRLWRAPIAYGDQLVVVAQAGRPVGGRFAKEADREHLDPDVDEVRNGLVQDLLYSGGLEKFGFAAGVGATPDEPSASPEKVRYRTDGLRAVLLFATRPLSLDDVTVLDWELPTHPVGSAED